MKQRQLFFAVELNLILWIVAGFQTEWKTVVVIGLVISAAVQHWAYYSLLRNGDASSA